VNAKTWFIKYSEMMKNIVEVQVNIALQTIVYEYHNKQRN